MKRTVALIVACIMVVAMVGCSGSTAPESTPAPAPAPVVQKTTFDLNGASYEYKETSPSVFDIDMGVAFDAQTNGTGSILSALRQVIDDIDKREVVEVNATYTNAVMYSRVYPATGNRQFIVIEGVSDSSKFATIKTMTYSYFDNAKVEKGAMMLTSPDGKTGVVIFSIEQPLTFGKADAITFGLMGTVFLEETGLVGAASVGCGGNELVFTTGSTSYTGTWN